MDTNTNPYSSQNPEQWISYPTNDFKNPNPDPNNYPNDKFFCDINFYNNNKKKTKAEKIDCENTIIKVDEKTFYLCKDVFESIFFPIFFLVLAIFTAFPFLNPSKIPTIMRIILIIIIIIFLILALYFSLAKFHTISLLFEPNSIAIIKKSMIRQKIIRYNTLELDKAEFHYKKGQSRTKRGRIVYTYNIKIYLVFKTGLKELIREYQNNSFLDIEPDGIKYFIDLVNVHIQGEMKMYQSL